VTRTVRLRQSDGGPVVTCGFRSCCLLFVPTPPWRLTAWAWPPRLDPSVRHLGASVPRRAAKGDPAINRCRQVRDPTARRGHAAFAGWCPSAARCCSLPSKLRSPSGSPPCVMTEAGAHLTPRDWQRSRVRCSAQVNNGYWVRYRPARGAVISTLAQLASPTGTSVDQMERRRSRWCGHGGS